MSARSLFLTVTAWLLCLPPAPAADELSCEKPSAKEMAEALGITLPRLPWHTANIWWDLKGPTAGFESLSMEVSIDRDVPSTYNLYIAPVGVAKINGLQFYGGIQTNINGWASKTSRERVHPGKGAIFSRWSNDKKTPIGLDHVTTAGDDCLVESAGYEGEFASVRRPLAWTKGTWTYEIRKGAATTTDTGPATWFDCRVRDPQGAWHPVGSLRFEGTEFSFWERHSAFVEVYSTEKIPRPGIPKVNVTFGWPMINGKPAEVTKASAYYPHKTGPASPDCANIVADGPNCRVELGPIFKRDEARRRHPLEIVPPAAPAPAR